MIVKRCPLCGGMPHFVRYTYPYDTHPHCWGFNANGEYEPEFFVSRVECGRCGATTQCAYGSNDIAIDAWNEKGRVFQKLKIEEFVTQDIYCETEEKANDG